MYWLFVLCKQAMKRCVKIREQLLDQLKSIMVRKLLLILPNLILYHITPHTQSSSHCVSTVVMWLKMEPEDTTTKRRFHHIINKFCVSTDVRTYLPITINIFLDEMASSRTGRGIIIDLNSLPPGNHFCFLSITFFIIHVTS